MKHLFAASAIALASTTMQVQAEPIRLLGSGDFDWQATAEGVAFAALQGDRFSEAYQAWFAFRPARSAHRM